MQHGPAKHPNKRRFVGLSLEKFAAAKNSTYDKQRRKEREDNLRAGKINKYRKLKAKLQRSGELHGTNYTEVLEFISFVAAASVFLLSTTLKIGKERYYCVYPSCLKAFCSHKRQFNLTSFIVVMQRPCELRQTSFCIITQKKAFATGQQQR